MSQNENACCVHIIDDDEAILHSLQMLLNSKHIPSLVYRSAEEFLDESNWSVPGCIILDLRMPGMGGERLIEQLSQSDSQPPVIILTAHGTIDSAITTLKAGAIEFLRKPCDSDLLLSKISEAIESDRARLLSLQSKQKISDSLDSLTPREMDVVTRLVKGKTSSEIASELGLQTKSIDIYRGNILNKLGYSSTPELICALLRDDPGRWNDQN